MTGVVKEVLPIGPTTHEEELADGMTAPGMAEDQRAAPLIADDKKPADDPMAGGTNTEFAARDKEWRTTERLRERAWEFARLAYGIEFELTTMGQLMNISDQLVAKCAGEIRDVLLQVQEAIVRTGGPLAQQVLDIKCDSMDLRGDLS